LCNVKRIILFFSSVQLQIWYRCCSHSQSP
jgi:hypothetical protein